MITMEYTVDIRDKQGLPKEVQGCSRFRVNKCKDHWNQPGNLLSKVFRIPETDAFLLSSCYKPNI